MTTEATLEQNKAFIRQHFEEFVNRKNAAIAYQNFAPDFLDHDEPDGESVGPESAKQMIAAVCAQYPHLHVMVEDILAEGDKVMVRHVWRGREVATGNALSSRALCSGASPGAKSRHAGQR